MCRRSQRNTLLVLTFLSVVSLVFIYQLSPRETYSGSAHLDNASDPLVVLRLSTKLEYVNDELKSKNSELLLLQDRINELSVIISQNADGHRHAEEYNATTQNMSEVLNVLPTLFKIMPHLQDDIKSLYPHRFHGVQRHQAKMVLAVPHVHRPKVDYLMQTIESLFKNMNAAQKQTTTVVIMVAEPWNESYFDTVVQRLTPKFTPEMESGCLQVILPPAKWYPDLDHLPEKWGDKPDRAKWRTKQNLDYAFMMLYCSLVGELYVQLEDDITAKDNYVGLMQTFAAGDRWELLEFSQLGFIGKMFRSANLPKFVLFILMFYKHKPVDWLLDNYFWVQECHGKTCSDMSNIRKRYRPSLFQHEGYHSSLAGKVQKLKDKDYNKKGDAQQQDPVIFAHPNPTAKRLETSLKQYQKFSLEQCYAGKSVFWALNPQPNDYVVIEFKEVQPLKVYKIVSGDRQHKDDRLMNATLEVMPASGIKFTGYTRLDDSGFILLQYFNTSARRSDDDPTIYTIAEGKIPTELGKISAFRILSHSESQNWVIFSEMWFF